MEKDSYDVLEVVEYVKYASLSRRTRKRPVVDKRKYVAAILVYKFGLTFQEVADILGLSNHTTIIHSLKSLPDIINSPSFLLHTEYVRKRFPFSLKDKRNKNPKEFFTVGLTAEEKEKLKNYKDHYKIPSYKLAIRELIRNI